MTDESFAERVWIAYKDLEKREKRPIPQRELAERIEARGGHPTRQDDVSRWFRGAARPTYEELPAIAEVLRVDLAWLTFGAPQPFLGDTRKADRTGDALVERGRDKRRRKGA